MLRSQSAGSIHGDGEQAGRADHQSNSDEVARPDRSHRPRRPAALVVLAFVGLALLTQGCTDDDGSDGATDLHPFANPVRPPAGVYDGPVFEVSAEYPTGTAPMPDSLPWQEAIGGGQITVKNAGAYVDALKAAITDDMTTLLYDFPSWDATEAGWYNQPWLAPIRDGIHGTFKGSDFDPGFFPISGLTEKMTTHVLVYYDHQAAYSLGGVWGETGLDPVPGLEAGAAQFPEGSIIVKPAFTTATPATWPPLAGALTWPLWGKPHGGKHEEVQLFDAALFQFDIIVKDSQSAPESQWVFSTLVYDKDAPGTGWDKMVPLGAMWGNDPGVDSPEDCNYLPPDNDCPALSQTWIDPDAPIYSMETLGWGGRLSGPNDGAVDISASVLQPNGTVQPYDGRYAMSSCMSCHGPAEYPTESFLLPTQSDCADDSCNPKTEDGRLVYYPAGSTEFLRWFQSRPGTEPQDPGSIPLDYDMVYAFKSLPAWFDATGQDGQLNFIEDFNDYRGVSPDHFDD